MPTYQYACTECGHAFEQFQSFSDDALTDCPECAGRLRKLFNAVGVVFKGSGFYRNDSRSDGKPSGADGTSGSNGTSSDGTSTDGSSSSGSSSSADAKPDAKPASSSDSKKTSDSKAAASA